ncbi:MAG: 3-phosphoserine/phosphohydroxythreonine transaminase [Eubacteriales bacterium]|nr:3-phosphoserine/phosphohydroxythreonine transaminase [Eubacteriales bacterium]MDD4461568.1 3-phosphoserine/phosphohydroxythreonine transaminase [Eubacteriales bacterium]
MHRVYNFSAGPSVLPLPVLQKAASEITDYQGCGMSVMEMSHRSPVFEAIIADTERRLRDIMAIPDNYRVLFLQGGATAQFAAVPLNLLSGSGKADYIISGQFSQKAYQEACHYGDIRAAASSEATLFDRVPEFSAADLRPDADYVHICYNNTIFGSRFPEIPDTGGIPLVADLSSCILSEPIDISRFALVYAGAQKNMAPAGLTVVIVREDLLGRQQAQTPQVMNYQIMDRNGSMLNTPPCYSIYMCGLVLEWLDGTIGGLARMAEINRRKAEKLYRYLDQSHFYKTRIMPEHRSIMNVTFATGEHDLDALFSRQAEAAGLVNLAGHRSTGGMRASIYNAMPEEGIDELIRFMTRFAAEQAHK